VKLGHVRKWKACHRGREILFINLMRNYIQSNRSWQLCCVQLELAFGPFSLVGNARLGIVTGFHVKYPGNSVEQLRA
jgi:hypothetical protein